MTYIVPEKVITEAKVLCKHFGGKFLEIKQHRKPSGKPSNFVYIQFPEGVVYYDICKLRQMRANNKAINAFQFMANIPQTKEVLTQRARFICDQLGLVFKRLEMATAGSMTRNTRVYFLLNGEPEHASFEKLITRYTHPRKTLMFGKNKGVQHTDEQIRADYTARAQELGCRIIAIHRQEVRGKTHIFLDLAKEGKDNRLMVSSSAFRSQDVFARPTDNEMIKEAQSLLDDFGYRAVGVVKHVNQDKRKVIVERQDGCRREQTLGNMRMGKDPFARRTLAEAKLTAERFVQELYKGAVKVTKVHYENMAYWMDLCHQDGRARTHVRVFFEDVKHQWCDPFRKPTLLELQKEALDLLPQIDPNIRLVEIVCDKKTAVTVRLGKVSKTVGMAQLRRYANPFRELGYQKHARGCFYVFEILDANGRVLYIKFGISNAFQPRRIEHEKNLRLADIGLTLRLLKVQNNYDGNIPLQVESALKRELKGKTVDLGVDGFKSEVVPVRFRSIVLKALESAK